MNLLAWLGITVEGKPLDVGDAAPEVVSRDEHGNEVRLAELYRDGITLVYFYPKADTSGCTAQACSLRDSIEELKARAISVVGVSTDKPAAQLRFKEKYHLPFLLLADHDRVVAKAFGVRFLFGMAQRQSFLIQNGRVIWRDLHASTRGQARDVLKVIETLP